MAPKRRDAEIELDRVLDRAAELILSASDEEILADASKAGEDPKEVAREQRAFLLSAIQKHKRKELAKAREAYNEDVSRMAKETHVLPKTTEGRLDLLIAALRFQPGLESALTVQHREFTSLSDQDVQSYLRQLAELGVLDALRESESED